MLAQLNKVRRRFITLVWVMMLAFAIAPAASAVSAQPVGAFSHVVVHAHDHDQAAHIHHLGDHDHDDVAAVDDNPTGNPSQLPVHVHSQACCPSVIVPVFNAATPQDRVAGIMAIAPIESMKGAPPGRLLRPPIRSILL